MAKGVDYVIRGKRTPELLKPLMNTEGSVWQCSGCSLNGNVVAAILCGSVTASFVEKPGAAA